MKMFWNTIQISWKEKQSTRVYKTQSIQDTEISSVNGKDEGAEVAMYWIVRMWQDSWSRL